MNKQETIIKLINIYVNIPGLKDFNQMSIEKVNMVQNKNFHNGPLSLFQGIIN